MMKKILMASLLALTPLAAAAQDAAEFPIAEAIVKDEGLDMSCITRIFPMMDFSAASVSEAGDFMDVTGGNEAQLMRARSVRCTAEGVEAQDVSFFPNAGVASLLERGSSIRIGSLKAQPSANQCAMGAVTELSNFRMFSWDRDATGTREVVMKINGENISRPLIYKLSIPSGRFIPRVSPWNCRVAGDLHMTSPALDISGSFGQSRISAASSMISLDLPLNVEEYRQARDSLPVPFSIVVDAPVYTSGATEIARMGNAVLDLKFPDATTLILMARKYAPVLALPQGRFDATSFGADVSNALAHSEVKGNVSFNDITVRPGVAFGRALPGNYESLRVMGGKISTDIDAKTGVIGLTSTVDIESLAKFDMSAGIAPRKIGREELTRLQEGAGDAPLVPRRARASIQGEDLGLVQILKSVYGYGFEGFPAIGPLMLGMEGKRAELMFAWDQETGRKISIREVSAP